MCQTAGVAGSAKESQPFAGLWRVRPGSASRSHPAGRRTPTEVGQFDRSREPTGRKFCPARVEFGPPSALFPAGIPSAEGCGALFGEFGTGAASRLLWVRGVLQHLWGRSGPVGIEDARTSMIETTAAEKSDPSDPVKAVPCGSADRITRSLVAHASAIAESCGATAVRTAFSAARSTISCLSRPTAGKRPASPCT